MAEGRAALAATLRRAEDLYPRPGDETVLIVHGVRKELKRAASLCRLFAPLVGAAAYEALDVANAARRSIGEARDLDILPQALNSLPCAPGTRDTLLRAVAIERSNLRGHRTDSDAARRRTELAAAAAAVANWDLGAEDPEALLLSLRLTYRSAKRLGRAAWASHDADDLHELRARVVDLGHQLAIVEPAWPALLGAAGAELARLRQSLGLHNDLTVLGEFALSRRELDSVEAESLVQLILRKRRPLERRAQSQFERLFAERPNAFARRIGAYLAFPQKR